MQAYSTVSFDAILRHSKVKKLTIRLAMTANFKNDSLPLDLSSRLHIFNTHSHFTYGLVQESLSSKLSVRRLSSTQCRPIHIGLHFGGVELDAAK